ncbi:MAG: glycosyltransferase [Deltaproteobacteria bacterium]|nr:glycosyltransferase [Deltaproteobacteria bacterium]
MKISIIVPFYRAGKYIEDCIQALLTQDFPSDLYEIIMVNNNSPDQSAEIVKRYPRIRLLSQSRQGSYAARNLGIAEATGDIIAFTDSDCVPAVDWLRNISKAMLQPHVGIVLGIREFPVHSTSLTLLSCYVRVKDAYMLSSHDKDLFFGYTNNMAVKKPLLEELGPFMELSRGADTIFVRQAVDAYGCNLIHYTPDVRVRHMEMTGVFRFYQKTFTYGWSNRHNQRYVSFRPLTYTEKFHIFIKTVKRHQFTILQSVYLLFLLLIGDFCQKFGRGRAVLSPNSPVPG